MSVRKFHLFFLNNGLYNEKFLGSPPLDILKYTISFDKLKKKKKLKIWRQYVKLIYENFKKLMKCFQNFENLPVRGVRPFRDGQLEQVHQSTWCDSATLISLRDPAKST